ncbi:hypothetical protein JXA47_14015 [Candidatus Sumerlaeota bacterium]|nr:hypothetical protein [Candidatus Sumerlaeota bacterium]
MMRLPLAAMVDPTTLEPRDHFDAMAVVHEWSGITFLFHVLAYALLVLVCWGLVRLLIEMWRNARPAGPADMPDPGPHSRPSVSAEEDDRGGPGQREVAPGDRPRDSRWRDL